MRISVNDWLMIAKEDVVSDSVEVKALFDFFNESYNDGYFNNNYSINECYKHLYNYAYDHKKNNFFSISGPDLLILFNEYLGYEENKIVTLNTVKLEDLL